jgi:bifunctional polynucleotide phosphatase/kinase
MLQSITNGLYAYSGLPTMIPLSNDLNNLNTNNIIAAFDLDWTLVRTIRGRFPKDENDWAFLPNRIGVLKYYQEMGHTIVIFTNQGYKGNKLIMAINRINKIISALIGEKLNISVLAATDNNLYRKPNIGMWQVFIQNISNFDKNQSFYVGDAAGRNQDHSSDDRDFATTIGLKFYVPEEIFPSTCLRISDTICIHQNSDQIVIPDTQTMFIFVGMPGSGKSTFYQQKLSPKGWVHVNQDTLKTQAKVLNAVRIAASSGQSIAIDATNPNPDKRREYIIIAAQYKIPTMILYFVGNGYGWNKLRTTPVPDIAYNMYYKNLVEPTPQLDLVPVIEIA